MTNKMQTGSEGEVTAADYLLNKGYLVIERNHRYRRAEVDLIVKTGDCLVFVEVKTRTGSAFGFPENFVSASKKRLILMAAEYYTYRINWVGKVRFDIISILKKEITHFEDAFY